MPVEDLKCTLGIKGRPNKSSATSVYKVTHKRDIETIDHCFVASTSRFLTDWDRILI